jgi:hypothetical protein
MAPARGAFQTRFVSVMPWPEWVGLAVALVVALAGLVVCFACFGRCCAVVRGDDMRPIWARRREAAAFHLGTPRD